MRILLSKDNLNGWSHLRKKVNIIFILMFKTEKVHDFYLKSIYSRLVYLCIFHMYSEFIRLIVYKTISWGSILLEMMFI